MEDRTLKQKLFEIIEKISRRVLIFRIERALGIELFDWQIAKIFDDTPFPEHVQKGRRQGKTTAQILFVLFNKRFNNKAALLHVDNRGSLQGLRITEDQFAAAVAYIFGEDGLTLRRRDFFARELLSTKRAMSNHHIKTNAVVIRRFNRLHTYK